MALENATGKADVERMTEEVMTSKADVKRRVRIGDDVLYVLDRGRSHGESRPAKVVLVFPGDLCNLVVFTDGTNDFSTAEHGLALTHWRTSIQHDPSGAPNTWHWPYERAET